VFAGRINQAKSATPTLFSSNGASLGRGAFVIAAGFALTAITVILGELRPRHWPTGCRLEVSL
jgi:hypothetical protein